MAIAKLAGSAVLLATLALTACTSTDSMSRSERTRIEIDKAFGPVGPRSNRALFEQMDESNGFSLSRVYSEKPSPFSFGQKVPESFENALVIDVAIEMKIVDSFPIYRLGVEPKKISARHVEMWPSHIVIDSGRADLGPLAARLPEDRTPDPMGVIWTDWTYCGDCFGLGDMPTSNDPELFDRLDAGFAAAAEGPLANSSFARGARFTSVPGVGILIGDAAEEMASKASEVTLAARARHAEMEPARQAYAEMITAHAASRSPMRAVEELCGRYEPNRDRKEPAAEAARFKAFETCSLETIGSYDRPAREGKIDAFRKQESQLAKLAGITAVSRVSFPPLEAEIEEALSSLERAADRYSQVSGAKPAPVAKGPRPQARKAPGDDVVKAAQAVLDAPPLPAPYKPAAAPAEDTPVSGEMRYVARLVPGGANMETGKHAEQCLGAMSCDTGSVVALITAKNYCAEPGGVTATQAGWGMVVQKYDPATQGELALVQTGDGKSQVHVSGKEDRAVVLEALEKMRALAPAGEQVHFTSYPEFYEISTEKLGCSDEWRDAAKHRVIQNPAYAVIK